MSSSEGGNCPSKSQRRYKGVRRRRWGKWVSEIRVPGKRDRLWLGSYVAPEAAAVAHDIAYYCLRERTSLDDFNFPLMLPAGIERAASPRAVQKAATDAGLAIDAQFIWKRSVESSENAVNSGKEGGQWHSTNNLSKENGVNYGQEGGGAWQSTNNFSMAPWKKNEYREGDPLNVSVEDYLH